MTVSYDETLSLKNHAYGVTYIGFSSDERLLISAGYDGLIKVRETISGKEVITVQAHSATDRVVSASLSNNGQLLATSSFDQTVKLWEVSSGRQVAKIDQFTETAMSLAFSPDGLLIACGTLYGAIQLWDGTLEQQRKVLVGHTGAVNSLEFSPNGMTLVSVSEDCTTRLWKVATGKHYWMHRDHTALLDVAFSIDSRHIAVSKSSLPNTGIRDGQVQMWRVPGGRLCTLVRALTGQLSPVMVKEHVKYVASLDFSPRENLLAIIFDQNIEIWDVLSKNLIIQLTDYNDYPSYVTFSRSGTLLAYGTSNGYVKLLELQSTNNRYGQTTRESN